MAIALAKDFIEKVKDKQNKHLTVALAGGSTPEKFYRTLAKPEFEQQIDWYNVHFFFGDERCVKPEDPQRNYGMVKFALLNSIDLPKENIHRIKGENEPDQEASKYGREIERNLVKSNGLPAFDIMYLGLGTDGHTASLFPNTENLDINDQYCSVATHPQSGQRRITLNLELINNSREINFIVTGSRKAEIIDKLVGKKAHSKNYPASLVREGGESINWYLDRDAAKFLKT